MANYVDAGTQTIWQGLTQRAFVRPDILLSAPRDTSTPPDEMITDKPQFIHGLPSIIHTHQSDNNPSPPSALLERRKRPGLSARISLPGPEINDEVPMSPPPTHAILSPLLEANKRHAGHTPLIPRALSPEPEAVEELAQEHAVEQQSAVDDQIATPDLDEALKGALTLPTNPVDGADDFIELDALTHALSKVAKQQATLRGEFDDDTKSQSEPKPVWDSQPGTKPRLDSKAEELQSPDDGLPLSRKVSSDSRRSAAIEGVDGVILKTPPSNFGTPFGQL